MKKKPNKKQNETCTPIPQSQFITVIQRIINNWWRPYNLESQLMWSGMHLVPRGETQSMSRAEQRASTWKFGRNVLAAVCGCSQMREAEMV